MSIDKIDNYLNQIFYINDFDTTHLLGTEQVKGEEYDVFKCYFLEWSIAHMLTQFSFFPKNNRTVDFFDSMLEMDASKQIFGMDDNKLNKVPYFYPLALSKMSRIDAIKWVEQNYVVIENNDSHYEEIKERLQLLNKITRVKGAVKKSLPKRTRESDMKDFEFSKGTGDNFFNLLSDKIKEQVSSKINFKNEENLNVINGTYNSFSLGRFGIKDYQYQVAVLLDDKYDLDLIKALNSFKYIEDKGKIKLCNEYLINSLNNTDDIIDKISNTIKETLNAEVEGIEQNLFVYDNYIENNHDELYESSKFFTDKDGLSVIFRYNRNYRDIYIDFSIRRAMEKLEIERDSCMHPSYVYTNIAWKQRTISYDRFIYRNNEFKTFIEQHKVNGPKTKNAKYLILFNISFDLEMLNSMLCNIISSKC